MRKLLCSLLLPLILLLTQQGAVVHALSHLGAHGSTAMAATDAPDPVHAKDTLCALCLGLQHLAGWVAPVPPVPELLDLAHVQATLAPPAWRDRNAPEARSRGPPLSL